MLNRLKIMAVSTLSDIVTSHVAGVSSSLPNDICSCSNASLQGMSLHCERHGSPTIELCIQGLWHIALMKNRLEIPHRCDIDKGLGVSGQKHRSIPRFCGLDAVASSAARITANCSLKKTKNASGDRRHRLGFMRTWVKTCKRGHETRREHEATDNRRAGGDGTVRSFQEAII